LGKSVVEAYIEFLYRNLDEDEIEEVFNIPPGKIVLRGSPEELFNHRHVALWHRFLVSELPNYLEKVVLILPCSRTKPYSLSPTYRIALATLRREGALGKISILALSEPMVLVPLELDAYYPFANYELPPTALSDRDREYMAQIISRVLTASKNKVRRVVAALPKLHEKVMRMAARGTSVSIDIVPYGRRAFESVAKAATLAAHLAKNYER